MPEPQNTASTQTCESFQFDEGFFYCDLPPNHEGPHQHTSTFEWETAEEDGVGETIRHD